MLLPFPVNVAASTYHPSHAMGNKQIDSMRQVNDFVVACAEDIGGILWDATETAKSWMVRLVVRLSNCMTHSVSVQYIISLSLSRDKHVASWEDASGQLDVFPIYLISWCTFIAVLAMLHATGACNVYANYRRAPRPQTDFRWSTQFLGSKGRDNHS